MSTSVATLRLAIVRQRYNPFGGAERFIERALDALRNQGVAVTVITRRWTGPAASGPVRVCDPFYVGSLWRDASFGRAACALATGGEFDLVQSHERLACCDVFRAGDGVHREWLRQRARVQGPLARLATRLNPYHRHVLRAERTMFGSPRLKAVICNSDMVRDEIRRNFPIDAGKLHVIYNAVDTTQFHPGLRAEHRMAVKARLGIPAEAPVLLFVGSGFQRKGLATVLDAMAAASPDTHLIVVGKDKRLAAYRAHAVASGLGARCHFEGGQQDVRPYYGAADLLLLPALYEPFANVTLEALAAGVPVLTSRTNGGAELVERSGGGHAHDALDASAFAASIGMLLEPDRHAAASAAAVVAVRDLTPERMAQAFVDLYAGLRRSR